MNQQNKPAQYIQGWTEFYKLKFNLSPDVLIPRPETEILVDEVLNIAYTPNPPRAIRIIDVGTGSGVIAISIAKNLPQARILALDISSKALVQAEENAKLNKVENKIFFLESDLFSNLAFHPKGVKLNPDIIVANLPYIPTWKISKLENSVKDFEPILALDGGHDGFDVYRKMFEQMNEKNFFPKYLLCEIDEDQGKLALAEVNRYLPKSKAEIKKDLAKKDRILVIKF
ncbi:peptide chain release factor N(5)-glutamine methyltransferase [Candidatus Daviesbacteria bacterium]|nr:peptide chain release factor N(5)-glutamine methyltransferase [Candidatus Daviesbacteria bacterium]